MRQASSRVAAHSLSGIAYGKDTQELRHTQIPLHQHVVTVSAYRSEATRTDCVINVSDVRVEAAKIALAFSTAFAQCGHRAGLYHFEKIELRRCAYF